MIRDLGLGSLAMLSGIGCKAEKDKEKGSRRIQTERPSLTKAPDAPRIGPKEYDLWSARIETPDTEIDRTAKPWSQDEMKAYFVPKEFDDEALDMLYNKYIELKSEILAGQAQNTDPRRGAQLMRIFLDQLFREYTKLKPDLDMRGMRPGDAQFQDVINQISRLLIHRGEWFTLIAVPTNASIGFFKVQEVSNRIKLHNAERDSFPVVSLSGSEVAVNNPNEKHAEALAETNLVGGYVMYESEGSERLTKNFEGAIGRSVPAEATQEYRIWQETIKDEALRHESMHVILQYKYGIDYRSEAKAVKKGPIGMASKKEGLGAYILNQRDYEWAETHQLHELVACGHGLMTSGDDAIRVAHMLLGSSGLHTSYTFANSIFIQEMANSGRITGRAQESLAKVFQGKPVRPSDMVEVAKQIPVEKLHKIGERMVKLGLYLARRTQ